MVSALTNLNGIELITGEASSEKRRELLSAVTDIFLVTETHQNKSDQQLFNDLMERIAYEMEVEARAQLAAKICSAEKVSRKLAVRLANDEIDVAGPMLERSPVLEESDLIDVIRNKSQDHIYSIAGRQEIPEGVSSELVDRGDDRAVTRLAGNSGANISSDSFDKIVDRAEDDEQLVNVLGSRGDLPSKIMNKIKSRVSGRLKSELEDSNPDLDGQFISELIEKSAEDIDLDYCQESISEFEKLHRASGLNEKVILRLAREKRLPDLVHCLALLAELDNWSVSQCLLKAEIPALAILCKALGFKSQTFLALAELRKDRQTLQSSYMAKAARDFDALKPETAQRVMRFLKLRLKMSPQETSD